MAVTDQVPASTGPVDERWYALSADDVVQRLGVDPATGLAASTAAERLESDGPNALPAEAGVPGWRRFIEQYAAYMQIILLVAGIVSFAIGEWSTGVLLLVLTVVNAVVGLRQEGKAESAMNALKSLTKQTARVRRGGVESSIPVEEVVLGDVVLITAGDNVAADGRIIQANSLDIDESALTGESTPASKTVDVLADVEVGAGDQTNMAFMNTPVTHGSGVMVVTARAADAEVGKIAGMLTASAKEQTPLTKQLNTMTLVDRRGRAGDDDRHVLARDFEGPIRRHAVRHRDRPGDRGDPYGAANRPPGDSLGRRKGACRRERDRQGPHVRRDARIDIGDQLGQDRDAHDEPDDRRRTGRRGRPLHDLRDRLRPRGQRAARRRDLRLHRRRRHPVHHRQRRQARERRGRRRPHRGRAARPGPQGGARHRSQPGAVPPIGHAAVRPHLQAHGDLQLGNRLVRKQRGALFRQGSGSRRDRPRRDRPRRGSERAVGRDPGKEGRRCRRPHGGGRATRDGRGIPRSRRRHVRCRRRLAGLRDRPRDGFHRRDGRSSP